MKDTTEKTYHLHWCKADPFGRFVILVVGDYREAVKECKRKFKSFDPSFKNSFFEEVVGIIDENPIWGNPSTSGRTVQKGGDVFVWFPTFPTPGTLAHELLHAVDDILKSAGVKDTHGETDAYLLGYIFEHFFSVLEKDKKESLQNENR